MPGSEDEHAVGQEQSSAPASQQPTGKWWESKLMITLLTLILGAVAPVTTAVKEHFQIKKEAERAQQNQEQHFQMEYLKAVLSNDNYDNRKLVLRFLQYNAIKKETRDWAIDEIRGAEQHEARDKQELARKEQLKKNVGSAKEKNSPQQEERLQIITAEIERLRKRLDSTAVVPASQLSGERYRCVDGTVRALGGPGGPETRTLKCLNSLAADGTPPIGIFGGLGAFTYSWSTAGVPCECVVTLSFGN